MAHLKLSGFSPVAAFAALLCVVYAVCAVETRTTGKASAQENAADLAALAKARVDRARTVYEGVVQSLHTTIRVASGEVVPLGRPEDACLWSVRWLNAERDMARGKEGRVAALEGHLARMKKLQHLLSGMPSGLMPALWTLRKVNTGDFVQLPGGDKSTANPSTMFVVERDDMVRVFVDVPEEYARYVQQGTKAPVSGAAPNGSPISATVTRTSWAIHVEESSKVLSIRITGTSGSKYSSSMVVSLMSTSKLCG
jgi:hypothetical protein